MLLALVAAMATASCARLVGARAVSANASTSTTFHEIAVGEDKRGFLLHRPSVESLTRALPVFVILHGSSANANVVMDESGFNAVADSIGALVAYPNGTGGIPYVRLFWNFRDCCGAGHRPPDEGAMVNAIVDTLAHHFTLDRSRIAVVGFSDAATLAYEIACASSTVTAIGVISGEVPESNCRPSPAVATIVFHGTADANIRYGQTERRVADWASRDGCRASRRDTTRVFIHDQYAACDHPGVSVDLYSILGGQHAWPGGKPSWFLAPHPSREVNASRMIADFVMRHPRVVQ